MLRKYIFPIALALLVMLGQQSALLHELSHIADYSGLNNAALNGDATTLGGQAYSELTASGLIGQDMVEQGMVEQDLVKQNQAQSNVKGEINTGQQKQLPHTQLCDKCLGYAQITGAVAASTTTIPMLASSFSAIAFISPRHLCSATHAYSARAPPQSA